jgi:hypothetical protein
VARLWRSYAEAKRILSNSYAFPRISQREILDARRRKMTLVFTRNRLGNYRFARNSGRNSAKPARAYVSRAMRGAKVFFGAVLRVIGAAKLRRIERELRIRGPHHDWLRIDDDHFTPIDH